jgi:hypothetical protein
MSTNFRPMPNYLFKTCTLVRTHLGEPMATAGNPLLINMCKGCMEDEHDCDCLSRCEVCSAPRTDDLGTPLDFCPLDCPGHDN